MCCFDGLERGGPWDRPSEAKAGLSQRARWRSGIFRGYLVLAWLCAERETDTEIDVDHYSVACRDLAPQQVLGGLVFDPARDHPAQRPGREDAVVALLGERSLAAPVTSSSMLCSVRCLCKRSSWRSSICRICSVVRLLKTSTASTRLRNSGRNIRFSS